MTQGEQIVQGILTMIGRADDDGMVVTAVGSPEMGNVRAPLAEAMMSYYAPMIDEAIKAGGGNCD